MTVFIFSNLFLLEVLLEIREHCDYFQTEDTFISPSFFFIFLVLVTKLSYLHCSHQGLLGNQNMATSVDDVEEYSDYEESATYGYASRTRRSSRRKKTRRRDWDTEEDWELPMDYL